MPKARRGRVFIVQYYCYLSRRVLANSATVLAGFRLISFTQARSPRAAPLVKFSPSWWVAARRSPRRTPCRSRCPLAISAIACCLSPPRVHPRGRAALTRRAAARGPVGRGNVRPRCSSGRVASRASPSCPGRNRHLVVQKKEAPGTHTASAPQPPPRFRRNHRERCARGGSRKRTSARHTHTCTPIPPRSRASASAARRRALSFLRCRRAPRGRCRRTRAPADGGRAHGVTGERARRRAAASGGMGARAGGRAGRDGGRDGGSAPPAGCPPSPFEGPLCWAHNSYSSWPLWRLDKE